MSKVYKVKESKYVHDHGVVFKKDVSGWLNSYEEAKSLMESLRSKHETYARRGSYTIVSKENETAPEVVEYDWSKWYEEVGQYEKAKSLLESYKRDLRSVELSLEKSKSYEDTEKLNIRKSMLLDYINDANEFLEGHTC